MLGSYQGQLLIRSDNDHSAESELFVLEGVDLRGRDLNGVNFSGLDLRGVDLRGADLTQASLGMG